MYQKYTKTQEIIVSAEGIEPSTLGLWVPRSSQLSYTGIRVAGAGIEPTIFRLWAWRVTVTLSRYNKRIYNITFRRMKQITIVYNKTLQRLYGTYELHVLLHADLIENFDLHEQ